MRLEDSSNRPNPLIPIFEHLNEHGKIMLTDATLKILNNMFNIGGVYPDSQHELVELLEMFSEFYNLTEVVVEDNIYYFRKLNGQNS